MGKYEVQKNCIFITAHTKLLSSHPLNKKSYISLLFLLSFAVLFAHSITPHHHDEEKIAQYGGTDNDDDHNDIDNNSLANAFGSFDHGDATTIIYEAASTASPFKKVNSERATILPVQHFMSLLEKPPLIHSEHTLLCPVPSPYSDTKHFRGPPSAMA